MLNDKELLNIQDTISMTGIKLEYAKTCLCNVLHSFEGVEPDATWIEYSYKTIQNFLNITLDYLVDSMEELDRTHTVMENHR